MIDSAERGTSLGSPDIPAVVKNATGLGFFKSEIEKLKGIGVSIK